MRKLSITELNRKAPEEFRKSEKYPMRIVLDNIRSAHNIGSVFRSSDAFAIDCIHLCGITATPPNREIHKSALGAEDTVQWRYHATTQEAIQHCKDEGYTIVIIEQTTGSVPLQEYKPNGPVALVFGNEVEGVSEAAIELADVAVEIPQFGTKHSFNISVCAGIVMYDLFSKSLAQS
jgi:tRNA G18 (ribose-2'-O)-methylase SpoU